MAGLKSPFAAFDAGAATPEWRQVSDRIAQAAADGKLTIVVGSGISVASPTDLPTARAISEEVRRRLIARLGTEWARPVEVMTRGMPFEVMFGRLRELDDKLARAAVARLSTVTRPNGIHMQLARMLEKFAAKDLRIVTTNYDHGLGLAYPRAVPGHPGGIGVLNPEDVVPAGTPCAFYVHGYASAPETLVLDYDTEFTLDDWKVTRLREAASGRVLLFLGFSGDDLDVASELAAGKPSEVYWIRQTRASADVRRWSVAAREVIDAATRRSGIAYCGPDLGLVLGSIAGPEETVVRPSTSSERADDLETFLTTADPGWLELWAGWMALRAGFGRITEHPPHQHLLRPDQISEFRGFAQFYRGRYVDAAESWARASAHARGRGLTRRRLRLAAMSVEGFNRGGQTIRAIGRLISFIATAGRARPDSVLERSARSDLLATASLCWPLPAIYLVGGPSGRIARLLARAVARALSHRAFEKYLVIAAHGAEPGSKEYEQAVERYAWLGQRARLINLQRVAAIRVLLTGDIDGRTVRGAVQARRWSQAIADPGRTARSTLVLGELFCSAEAHDPGPQWATIARTQVSLSYWVTARYVYELGRVTKSRRLRVVGLSLLETS